METRKMTLKNWLKTLFLHQIRGGYYPRVAINLKIKIPTVGKQLRINLHY